MFYGVHFGKDDQIKTESKADTLPQVKGVCSHKKVYMINTELFEEWYCKSCNKLVRSFKN